VAYFAITGIVEANSGYNHHTKSGKLLIDKNLSENSRSLFKVLAGSPFWILKPSRRIGSGWVGSARALQSPFPKWEQAVDQLKRSSSRQFLLRLPNRSRYFLRARFFTCFAST